MIIDFSKTSSPTNTYGYDTLDRLTSAEYFSDSSDTESFDYDDLGNRESVNLRDGSTENYTVNDVNNQYNTIGGEALSYDAAGNVTCDADGYMYSWDHENHLTTIQKTNTSGELELVAEYVYDALGRRVGFTEYRSLGIGMVREFSYDGWRLLAEVEEDALEPTYEYYAYGNALDEVVLHHYSNNDGSLYYLHDHLNSPAALVADYNNGTAWSAGEIAERYEYNAYGKRYVYDADYNEVTGTNYTNVGFTGQRIDLLDYDTSTSTYKHSLCYYKNRWYSPEMGRFMSNDPLGVVPGGYMNGFSPVGQYGDGVNAYQYVRSNPEKYLDNYGTITWTDVINELKNAFKVLVPKANPFFPFKQIDTLKTTLGDGQTGKTCFWTDSGEFRSEPSRNDFEFVYENENGGFGIEGTPCTSGTKNVRECSGYSRQTIVKRKYCKEGQRYRDVIIRESASCRQECYTCLLGKWVKNNGGYLIDHDYTISISYGTQTQMVKEVHYADGMSTTIRRANCCECSD